MTLASDKQIDEAKKTKPVAKPGALSLLPIKPFTAGNMVMSHRSDDDGDENDEAVEEGKDMKVTGKGPKVRNQGLHNVLSGRKGGAMYDAKRDYVRAKEKQKQRRDDE